MADVSYEEEAKESWGSSSTGKASLEQFRRGLESNSSTRPGPRDQRHRRRSDAHREDRMGASEGVPGLLHAPGQAGDRSRRVLGLAPIDGQGVTPAPLLPSSRSALRAFDAPTAARSARSLAERACLRAKGGVVGEVRHHLDEVPSFTPGK